MLFTPNLRQIHMKKSIHPSIIHSNPTGDASGRGNWASVKAWRICTFGLSRRHVMWRKVGGWTLAPGGWSPVIQKEGATPGCFGWTPKFPPDILQKKWCCLTQILGTKSSQRSCDFEWPQDLQLSTVYRPLKSPRLPWSDAHWKK